MFTKFLFNGEVQYYATAGNHDQYRIVKRDDGYGYDVIVHKYDAELSAIDGQVIVEFIGKRLGMFGLLRDAKAHVKSLI